MIYLDMTENELKDTIKGVESKEITANEAIDIIMLLQNKNKLGENSPK